MVMGGEDLGAGEMKRRRRDLNDALFVRIANSERARQKNGGPAGKKTGSEKLCGLGLLPKSRTSSRSAHLSSFSLSFSFVRAPARRGLSAGEKD
jgi:hypothetical protein